MKIYYSVSVRGTSGVLTRDHIKKQIVFLKQFGKVLTEHLASDDPQIIDMNKNDSEIYEEDDRLLKSADIFIAEVTNPSLGVGFMISRALQYNKPVLCLTMNETLSAMINGCPIINKIKYKEEKGFQEAVKNFIKNKPKPLRIFLEGPPGSGKSSIAKRLSSEFGIANISTGALLREIVKDNKNPLSTILNEYMLKGELVPAKIMSSIIKKRFSEPDCIVEGYLLDGYPPSLEDLEIVIDNNIFPDLIFLFECSDKTAIQRQCNRKERETDEIYAATKRLEIYHQKIPKFFQLGNGWFPNSLIIRIDAEKDEENIWTNIKDTIINLLTHPQKSYLPIPLFDLKELKSTQFHFHVDAESHEDLVKFFRRLYVKYPKCQGQIKIYPIEYLYLGPQIKELKVYNDMMNFHSIEHADNEAFITGRMGAEFDEELMEQILEIAGEMNVPLMVEVEEYLSEHTLYSDGQLKIDHIYKSEGQISKIMPHFKSYLAKEIPPFELHLGFNIPKDDSNEPPIHLGLLMDQCSTVGMSNGGWFIFKNNNEWVYRSNEFSTDSVEECRLKLEKQALSLLAIVKEFGYTDVNIVLGLEIVHAIWHF